MQGWIGVDLDGTLAKYDGWMGSDYIGEPIIPMITRVKRWISEGKTVKVFTARVCSLNPEREKEKALISKWCEINIGQSLDVTSEKDYGMIEFWDDRCVQVIPNTGVPVKKQR